MRTFIILAILSGIQFLNGRPEYASYLPNGGDVPNPCRTSAAWAAVGHYNPLHYTIVKNQFGIDFRNHGFSWTPTLCRTDSDRDGHTNGEELGDPNCDWYEGQTVKFPASGHPGICEPVGDANCLAQQGFNCVDMENSKHLRP